MKSSIPEILRRYGGSSEIPKNVKPILIGGIPGVGKSSIAGYIAKNEGIDVVLSGDYMREFIRPFADMEAFGVLDRSVYLSWEIYGEKSSENIEKGFLAQAKIINTGLSAVLRRAIENGEPLIVESLYFVPDQLDKDILGKIIPLYLYISDKSLHEERLNERQKFTHFNSPGDRLSRELDTYRVMMEYSLKQCSEYGIPAFDNLDYLNTRERILDYVREKMGD